MSVPSSAPNKILDMDRKNLREIDGVVLDLDSYARHIAAASPAPTPQPPAAAPAQDAPAQGEAAHPQAVFAVEPVHIGWYEPAQPEQVSYPIMAGAIPPTGTAASAPPIQTVGSGSGAYLSSFATSYPTSWMTSYRYGSGSWLTSMLYGSGSRGSGVGMPGGFGLELI